MPSSPVDLPLAPTPSRRRGVRLRRLGLRAIGALVSDPYLVQVHGGLPSPVEDELGRLLKGSQPIVAGPWMSEVGFEVLYWIPFLRWAYERFEVDAARVTVVSRGGTRPWYDGLCGRYVDILDHMTVDEFRALTEARWAESGGQKQSGKSRWEDIVLDRLHPALHTVRSPAVLHPSLMYGAFRDYWLARAPVTDVAAHVRYSRFSLPALEGLAAGLPPGEFAAVKFYFRPSFPDCAENRRFVAELVRAVCERMPVVLLNTGLEVDEHLDFDPGLRRRVHRLAEGSTGAENLAVQTAIIGRAALFLGTYGGLAYLASALGVDAVAFWSDPSAVKPEHVRMGRIAAEALDSSLSAVDVGDADVLGWLGRTLAPEPVTLR